MFCCCTDTGSQGNSVNCCTCYDGGRIDGGWSHSQPQADMGQQLSWSQSQPQPNGEAEHKSKCCIHCVCFEGGLSNGWDHSGTRWTEDFSPTVTVIRENR